MFVKVILIYLVLIYSVASIIKIFAIIKMLVVSDAPSCAVTYDCDSDN